MNATSGPRIGVDFHTFDGIFQGSRSHLLGLYQAAIAQAPDLEFHFLLEETERLRHEHPAFDAPHVRLRRMPHRNALSRLIWQLPRLQQHLKLDLLHLQYRLPAWTAGPCVCTIHDVLFESHPQFFSRAFVQFARFSSRDALRRSAALFTVSDYSRRAMVEAYGVEPSHINVTRNGVDMRRFTPACEHLDGDLAGQSVVRSHGVTPGQYLCIVGRLEPRKNHANLIRAFLGLPEPRPPLLIVGQRDFAYRGVFDLVQGHGLQQQVRFLEQVDDATLPALIRHCAAFVYPTWAEGFGMPVLEAMASGASVVTSDNTSLPEVAGDIALMCNPADVSSIARAIQRALNETHMAKRERQRRGVERARQFTWQRSAESLLQVYRRLLAKP